MICLLFACFLISVCYLLCVVRRCLLFSDWCSVFGVWCFAVLCSVLHAWCLVFVVVDCSLLLVVFSSLFVDCSVFCVVCCCSLFIN